MHRCIHINEKYNRHKLLYDSELEYDNLRPAMWSVSFLLMIAGIKWKMIKHEELSQ